jgi:S1-C subfamily serine protease
MLGPYRAPASVPVDRLPDLPDRCVPPAHRVESCPHLSLAPARRLPPVFLKALSASATLLLLVASASLSAVAWTVTATLLEGRGARLADALPSRTRAPRVPSLASLGPESHDAEVLWGRAERFASVRHDELTLVRATLSPEVLEAADTPARVVHEPGLGGGLYVADVGPTSQAAMIGLRPGDLITAVNGFALRHPDAAVRALGTLHTGGEAVVELVRGGRAIALRIRAPRS